MENKCYRASINTIPKEQSKLRSSAIPFFFSVDFQREDVQVPLVQESLARCEKCKAYLSPFVEIINPGYKWKCNLCETVNEVSTAFIMKERRVCDNPSDPIANSMFNKTYFERGDLTNEIYEIEAPDSFNVATPEPPTICFLIDVSQEAKYLNILSSVLNCASEVLKSTELDPRTRISLMFFNESVYVLNKNQTLTVINGEVPLILSEKILFSVLKEDENSFFNIDFSRIERYFEDKKSSNMDYLFALSVCSQLRSATLFSFVSTTPNFGAGKVDQSTSLICKNTKYKDVADSLVRKNICCNLFVMARSTVELSTIKMPSQFTGGQIIHYSNYDGSDATSTSKFYCDLNDYLNRESNFGAVCRIRSNEGVVLKGQFGNFYPKGSDLLSFSNYNPIHSINFTIQLYSDVKSALYLQIAMARVVKSGKKLIRVMNICIPVSNIPFYESCDANSIAHCLCLESFYMESRKKLAGKENMETKLTEIWKELKTSYGRIPDCLYNLPTYILALMKSIPFRPDMATPTDFRSYYMYMLSNYTSKIVDLMIYPLLLNVLTENVEPLPLSLQSIDQNGLYVLDTGVNIFFYVGKNCDSSVVSQLFESTNSGVFIFNPPENELSKYVTELVVFLMNNRNIKPRFVLSNGQHTSVYNDIFFSYMYEDSSYQLPNTVEFRRTLDNK